MVRAGVIKMRQKYTKSWLDWVLLFVERVKVLFGRAVALSSECAADKLNPTISTVIAKNKRESFLGSAHLCAAGGTGDVKGQLFYVLSLSRLRRVANGMVITLWCTSHALDSIFPVTQQAAHHRCQGRMLNYAEDQFISSWHIYQINHAMTKIIELFSITIFSLQKYLCYL